MPLLQVLWDGHHVRGSPFRVEVDLHSSAADAIVIDANTLKMGIVNEDVKTVIDTRKAGPGMKLFNTVFKAHIRDRNFSKS